VLMPPAARFGAIFIGSIVALSVLGALAARAGGSGMLKGALRVSLWSALAMAITMIIGLLYGGIA
jgi:vacuolar iron transporter family protein